MKKIFIYLFIAIALNYGIWIIYDLSPFKTANESLGIITIVVDILCVVAALYQLMKYIFKLK